MVPPDIGKEEEEADMDLFPVVVSRYWLHFSMELVAGDCRKRVTDDFAEDIDSFDGSDGGCNWIYGSRQSGSLIQAQPKGNDDALATLADLASPPQKLRPIRCCVKPPSEDRHALDILAGTLDKLPEMGFLGDGFYEAPSGGNIADGEESGLLTREVAKDDQDSRMEFVGPNSKNRTSLSSSVDSDGDSSQGGKRKRKRREKLEHFLEKLVGSMMKRQEKMHSQLIKVMEKMERERILREEAWRKQEMERWKENEEARKQEISRSLSLISFIKTSIGHEIEIPQPQNMAEQGGDANCESARTHGEVKFGYSSGRRWPQEEVQALITVRGEVEDKTGKGGAIWDEISLRMQERGYGRSAKKCKEKWENMNKYYKRIMEGGKKQPEHSKTRSYFQKLGTLYKNELGNSALVDPSGEREE